MPDTLLANGPKAGYHARIVTLDPITARGKETADAHAAEVARLFASIARRYDIVNDLQSFGMHRLWKRQLVCLARPRAGQRALDVCCGTGDIALGLAALGMQVTGLDFTEAMLGIARARAERLARSSHRARGRRRRLFPFGKARKDAPHRTWIPPEFVQGDALKLPFPDHHFDVVTMGYGLRNLSSWEAGLDEMWRVAKPGGKVIVLEFGKPDSVIWRRLYFTWLRWTVPLIGQLAAGNRRAYAYILESLRTFPAQRAVAGRMWKLRGENVRVFNLLGGTMSINYSMKEFATSRSARSTPSPGSPHQSANSLSA